MEQQDRIFWIWFAEAVGANGADFRPLFNVYSSPYEIYHAEEAELEQFECLPPKIVDALCNKDLKRASEILDACERLGIGIMGYQSSLYPHPLRELKRPPAVLYYAGSVPNFEKHLCVGMVGTRDMSVYGAETAFKISYELAAGNAVIVSGMAAGIDGVCASGALRAGGLTVAVLGCGLDIAYPRHHGKLMQEIADHGLLLSEFPPGTRPVSYHFPMRNRIISGLSHAVVVVEAGAGSGSLITAKEAVVQGKDVFAIPAYGDGVGYESANGLLRDGAHFATCAADIFNRYLYVFPSTMKQESFRKAGKRSSCDMDYLVGMGVLKADFKERANAASRGEPMSQPEPPTERGGEKDASYETARADRSAAAAPSEPVAPVPKKTARLIRPRGEDPSPTQALKHKTPDDVLQSLDPVGLAVLQTMPDDRAVAADELGNLGYSSGEIITALTMLEIMGLVHKLPGALYTKA